MLFYGFTDSVAPAMPMTPPGRAGVAETDAPVAAFPNYYVDLDCDDKDDCRATINRHRVGLSLEHWRDRWDRYDIPAGG